MFKELFRKAIPTRNDRLIRKYNKTVAKINGHENELGTLDDETLAAKIGEFKDRYAAGETLDELLPEAFAVVREASRRALGLRHFDVQLMGGMVLHEGKISEMKTGEGKTLVATLPAYLNAVGGRSTHIVTVNDYLAKRDKEWMGKVYEVLGVTVGTVVSGLSVEERKLAYRADVTYGTNNEFGFDYLRDNMVLSPEARVQRGQHFAIVDEVDSILIDEARTPLIISGQVEQKTEIYSIIKDIVRKLEVQVEASEVEGEEGDGDFVIDEKSKQVHLTEEGHLHVEKLMTNADLLSGDGSLYDSKHLVLFHHVNAALRAQNLYSRDVEYLVKNQEVIIVDEFTGRAMPGRRWSEGLHQALEAKEGVPIQSESQTLAAITFQNYFRLYERLAGMTGTADTEAYEFAQIYGLEVVVVPTHRTMIREDKGDAVFLTVDEKFNAITEDIATSIEDGRPVLVGTASIENSEHLSGMLKERKIRHSILNAKHHEAESAIVANAGVPKEVTIATNMAGRGTDIVLGGILEKAESENDGDARQRERLEKTWQDVHDQVVAAGGLHVIGTERHESRRIDNQLRGRSGRQGDPGSSRFYLSLEDNLMRIFAGEKVKSVMGKIGVEAGEAIEHPWVSRAIENAQRKVESHNFDIRKNLLEYDDIASEQRKVIYQQRNELLVGNGEDDDIHDMLDQIIYVVLDTHIPAGSIEEQWEVAALEEQLKKDFEIDCSPSSWIAENPEFSGEDLRDKVQSIAKEKFTGLENLVGKDSMRELERVILLQTLDHHWREHLAAMDYLRQGIGLRGYAQKNPKQEYKREAFEMFEQMLEDVRHSTISMLLRVPVGKNMEQVIGEREKEERILSQVSYSRQEKSPKILDLQIDGKPRRQISETHRRPKPQVQTHRRAAPKVGRNASCHCGSGRKYKHCHGRSHSRIPG